MEKENKWEELPSNNQVFGSQSGRKNFIEVLHYT